MKQTYQRPEITVIHMEETVMQTLSTHGGTTPSPGGGLSKPGIFDEDEEDSAGKQTMSGYSPWGE